MMRICSLLPSATEILYSIGLGEHIVAISDDCDYPPGVRQKPIISKSILSDNDYSSREITSLVESHRHEGFGIYDLSEERLLELRPDLILTQELCEVCAIPYSQVVKAARVLDRSPKIISLEPRALGDVLDNIIFVGRLTGTEKKAEDVVSKLRSRTEAVQEIVTEVESRPRVLSIEWTDPLMVGGHWVPEMVETAGGRDGLVKAGESSRKLTWNTVSAYQPEVIVVMPCNYKLREAMREAQDLHKVEVWETLPAVRNNRVYAVDARGYFSCSGPRLVGGLEIMAEILHPQLCKGLAPPDSYERMKS